MTGLPPRSFGASAVERPTRRSRAATARRARPQRCFSLIVSSQFRAQTPAPAPHDHAAMPASSSWHLMQDGVVFFNFNHQGSPRGGDELAVQNWWMGMAERPAGTGRLKFTLMLSLEPATLGEDGYREIFQVGETLDGLPLIDRQHPHDFLMQAAAVWRTPLGRGYSLTLAGAAGRRTRARAGDVHAPGVGVREPHGAARPPHLRLDAHLDGRPDRRTRPRPVASRRLALSRRRAGRAALGSHGPRSARLMVGARLVPPDQRVDAAGVTRFPEDAGSARAGRRPAHHGLGVVVAHARQRVDGRHRRLRTQQQARRRLQRVPRRGHARLRRQQPVWTLRVAASGERRACASDDTPSSAREARGDDGRHVELVRTSTYPRAARAATW